ncbi:MAG TPA: PAS domain S-box protein [Candidatus Cryosericum sp.]
MIDKEIRSGEAAVVQKRSEEALASSLSLLKATMESTADGLLVVDLAGRITLWNHKFAEMWQIPEELLSKHLDELALNYVLQKMAQPEAFLGKVRELYGQPEASSNDQLALADGRIFERYSQPQRIGDEVVGRVWSFSDITERKQAEETLHNERLLLRTLIDNIPDSIYSKDLACRKTLANLTEARYLGVKSEADVLGKDDFDIYPKELAEKFFADDQLVLQTGEPVLNREEYILDEKQQKHWLLTSKLPLRNQEGRIIGLVGIGRDITERKQAEEENQRERAFFDQLVESAPEGIAIADTQGRIMRVNAEFVRMFGYGVDEVVGQCLDDLVAPPARQEEAKALTRSTIQGGKNLLETVRRRKDGTLVDVSLIGASILVAGKQAAVYAIYRDITDRKRGEEALRASEMRYRTFIDATSDLVFLKDESFRYLMSNGANNSFLGKPEGNVIGYTDFDLMPNETAEHCRASDQEALEKGKRVTSEESVGLRTYQTIKFPVPLPSGRVGLGCYIRDITERKQAEAQLRQSQKMEAIGELAGGVAHDFNNLLTGILGNIALMRSSLPPTDPLLENLNAAETAARQAADLTQGLLTFGRSAMVLPVPMKIADALDAALAILEQSLPATMQIVHDYEQTAWNVLVDQSQMTQILFNLAVNARDAMEGKGMLTIRARNEVVGEEYLQTHPFARIGEFVHLSIRDTGPGIPPAILEHLFEPFHTTKPLGSGTGLGLSIVYGAVKQAGGWITAVSTEGAGKTAPRIEQTCSGAAFDIYLPRCLETPPQSPPPSSPSVNVARGTVLVVEDEPVVRTVAQGLLSRSGYTVLTAPDGASALNILRDHPVGIGLILLDMTMPGMTTNEIVQAIRAVNPTVPILLNSGYTSNDAVRRMLEEGSVQGFLGKPYDLHQLVENVQKLISTG